MASRRFIEHTGSKERHINSYIHTIIQYIKELDRPVYFEEIERKTLVRLSGNRKLLDALGSNPKVEVGKSYLMFKPVYNIRSEKELEDLLKSTNCKNGISVEKLLESPIDVKSFIDNLLEKRIVYILKDSDGSEIIFHNKLIVDQADVKIKDLWSSIPVPNYTDIIKELSSAGIKMEQKYYEEKKNIVKKKTKIRRVRRNIKITNTHVKGLDLNDMDL